MKFYVNTDLVDQNLSYTPLLFPFWPPKIKKTTPFMSAVWQRYTFDAQYYCLVDEDKKADAILLPHNYWLLQRCRPRLLTALLADAATRGKPVIIDAYGDSDAEIPTPKAVILRTSQYRFKMKPNEIMVPAYVEDLREAYPEIASPIPRPKTDLPVIGFTGWATIPFKHKAALWGKTYMFRLIARFDGKYACFSPGVTMRHTLLKRLSASPKVQSNFLVRQTYSGHTSTLQGDVRTLRTQFIQNILASDYILNIKGNGNYSQRFYETLSLGRIPLFIDTACILPLENLIDYKTCTLFVDYRDIARIDTIIADFHQALSPEAFGEMQRHARRIFEQYLRVDRFTEYLISEVRTKLQMFQ